MRWGGIVKFSINVNVKANFSIVWSSEFDGISIFRSCLHSLNAHSFIIVRWGGIVKLSIVDSEKARLPIYKSSESAGKVTDLTFENWKDPFEMLVIMYSFDFL